MAAASQREKGDIAELQQRERSLLTEMRANQEKQETLQQKLTEAGCQRQNRRERIIESQSLDQWLGHKDQQSDPF